MPRPSPRHAVSQADWAGALLLEPFVNAALVETVQAGEGLDDRPAYHLVQTDAARDDLALDHAYVCGCVPKSGSCGAEASLRSLNNLGGTKCRDDNFVRNDLSNYN